MTEDKASEQPKKHALTPEMEANKWKPGQSGNPGGRPKDSLVALLNEYLNANKEADKKAVVQELIKLGIATGSRGQVAALREIFDRIDGKVPDTHKIESDVPINIIYKQVGDREE